MDSTITGWLHSHSFGTGNARIGSLSFPKQARLFPPNSTQASRRLGITRTRFLRIKHRHSSHRVSRRFSTGVGLVILLKALYAFRQSTGMGMEPSHGSPWPFYLHAPGLTFVTHGTACVPPAHVPPTTWEFMCPSKRT
jgi:hypothetical protein